MFNIWVEDKKDPDTKKIMKLMNAFGLTQMVTMPTHIAGHTLDQVYINESQMKIKTWVDDGLGISSDHYPVISELPPIRVESQTEIVSFRKMKDVDVAAFKEEIKRVQNESFSEENKFETNYNNYRTATEAVLEKFYPMITKKVT